MGVSSKKSTSTSNTNQNTTLNTTPTNPEWVTQGISGLSDKINSTFNGLDPYSLVAKADPLQTQAGQGASALTSSPNFGQASDILSGVASAGPQSVTAASLLDGLDKYMNPYRKDVVDTSLASYDQGAGLQDAQAGLDLANDATFGGSGGAIQRALLRGQLAQGRGQLAAGLNADAFNTGANLSNLDAGRRQEASNTNASLAEQALARRLAAGQGLSDTATAQGADTRANITTQAGIGDALRQIQQAIQMAPVGALGLQSSLLSGLPLDLFHGSNATGSMSGTTNTQSKESGATLGDWLSYFAANAKAAAAAGGSDIRLKQDIETVAQDPRGFRWVNFAYKGDPETRYRGVIAQEVRAVVPEAVREGPAGILFVDYSKLGG